MKVLVVGNKDDKEEVKRIMEISSGFGDLEISIVSAKEFEEINKTRDELLNKKHDKMLATTIPMNQHTTVAFCKDWPDPIQEYNNPRNRHERRKLAAESRRK